MKDSRGKVDTEENEGNTAVEDSDLCVQRDRLPLILPALLIEGVGVLAKPVKKAARMASLVPHDKREATDERRCDQCRNTLRGTRHLDS